VGVSAFMPPRVVLFGLVFLLVLFRLVLSFENYYVFEDYLNIYIHKF
jgi:hypothetical protein